MQTLGDAIPGGNTDLLYSGETGESVFSMQYFRNKANEFQTILNQMDAGQWAVQLALAANIDDELTADLQTLLDEFYAKRSLYKGTAEAINMGAAAINAAGGRFPQLSIPSGLGLAPLLPAVAIGAIATAATLITWGLSWLSQVRDRLGRAQLLDAVKSDPEKAAALAEAMARSDMALAAASESPLSSVAGIVKWGAIGLGAYLLWRAYSTRDGA